MDMNAINQNVVLKRGDRWSVSNDHTGRSDWFDTKDQAEAWLLYIEEDSDLALVSEDVIDQVAEARADDSIVMRWDNLQEELQCMYADLSAEFG